MEHSIIEVSKNKEQEPVPVCNCIKARVLNIYRPALPVKAMQVAVNKNSSV